MTCPVCNHRHVELNSPTCEYCGLVWTGEGAWEPISSFQGDVKWAGTIFCDCGKGPCKTPLLCEGIDEETTALLTCGCAWLPGDELDNAA